MNADAASTVEQLLAQAQQDLAEEAITASRVHASQALALAQAQGLTQAEVRAHILLCTVAHRQSDSAAAAHAASAQALSRHLNDPLLQAQSSLVMARVSWSVGDNDHALMELESAFPVIMRQGDPLLQFNVQNMLGLVCGDLGDTVDSLNFYENARAVAQAMHDATLEGKAIANMGARLLVVGEEQQDQGLHAEASATLERAVAFYLRALDLADAGGSQTLRVHIMTNQGAALVRLSRFDEALQVFEQLHRVAEALGEKVSLVHRCLYLARLHWARGDAAAARAMLAEGVDIGEGAQANNVLALLYEFASGLEEGEQCFERALVYYKRFHALRAEMVSDGAARRSQALAVRLKTEQALADVEVAREQSQALQQQYLVLTEKAEVLGREAMQDPLTGLANRRRLHLHLQLKHQQALLTGLPLCVAMLDIDHFKRINDDHSHQVGDAVLTRMGALLHAHCRGDDLAARYGGEEFVVVFDTIGLNPALGACERLRAAIQVYDWSSVAPGLAVTVSIGLADIGSLPSVEAGVALADALLYESKRGGRNRVSH